MRYANWPAAAAATALVAGCTTVLAGCTAAQNHHRATPAVPSTAPATNVAAGQTPPHQTPRQTPRQQAAGDAAAMLAAFIPPPHAARTAPLPLKSLAQPVDLSPGADQVSRTGWWRIAGQPQGVARWIQAHKPPGAALLSTGFGTEGDSGTVVTWEITFTLPDLPGVLDERQVIAQVAADGAHATAIRVDASAVWLPVRPPAETITASARLVTITPVGHRDAADRQVTITDPALVGQIAAAVNALPLYPPRSPMWCDLALRPGGDPAMRLTFRASAGGPALAVVTADQELCSLVNVAAGGKTMPALDGANTLIQQVMAIDRTRWPDFPAPAPTTPPATPR